jgi:hypothetical protein
VLVSVILAVTLIMGVTQVSPAAPADPAAPAITKPSWMQTPTADQLAFLYPKAASRGGRPVGMGTMACDVDVKGQLENCSVYQEDPPGLGFGEAAVKAARYFRMARKDSAGRSVAGGRVIVPIVFHPPR